VYPAQRYHGQGMLISAHSLCAHRVTFSGLLDTSIQRQCQLQDWSANFIAYMHASVSMAVFVVYGL